MYVKIEPTGTCERDGMVQIRLCMYLEAGDYGYEKHHILVPVIPETGYPGKVDEFGEADPDEYQKWLDGLPQARQDNPFHNHFIYVSPDTSDEDIMNTAEAFLHEAGAKWGRDQKLDLENPAVKKPAVTAQLRAACNAKVVSLVSKEADLTRKI